jgi:hypothetical protein
MKFPLILLLLFPLHGATLNSASVTKVINDVRILTPKKAAHTAKVGDRIGGSTSLQTGRRSRAEVTFGDKTVTRIGANSIFSLRKSGRDVELNSGSILLQVPKGKGATHIRTATVTAAITGTTLMMEYSVGNWVKVIVLEGEVKLAINGQKRDVTINPGEILVMDPNGRVVPEVMLIDMERLMKTSKLLDKKLFSSLPSETEQLIAEALSNQKAAIASGSVAQSGKSVNSEALKSADSRSAARDTTTTIHRPLRGPTRKPNILNRPGPRR